MKSAIYLSLVACLLISVAPASVVVEMLVDGIPAGGSQYLIPPGANLTIDFSIAWDDQYPEFFGIVELQGVGFLSEPTNPGFGVFPPTPPIHPPNRWLFMSRFEDPMNPSMGVFASSIYDATEPGIATINLYQTDASFTPIDLIDSFDIHVIPEPATIALLSIGGLFIRKKK